MNKSLKELRLERGWTQKELASKFPVPKAVEQISRWENSVILPDSRNLQYLANIFGVNAQDILIDKSRNQVGEVS